MRTDNRTTFASCIVFQKDDRAQTVRVGRCNQGRTNVEALSTPYTRCPRCIGSMPLRVMRGRTSSNDFRNKICHLARFRDARRWTV